MGIIKYRIRTSVRRDGFFVTLFKQRELLIMVIPAFLATLIFSYIPMYGITFAFRELDFSNGVWQSPFADPWYNYFQFLNDEQFWRVMINSVVIAGSKFLFGFPAPIILALMLNEIRLTFFKRTVQTISYLPHFISWVIAVGIFSTFLSLDSGPVNKLLQFLFGIQPIDYLGSAQWFVPLMVFTSVWKSVGWGTIIYLAAITALDPQLYEAAKIDGAGKWKQVVHITIPGMMPTITILLVLSIPGIVNAGFDQIYNFLNPLVLKVGDVIDTYVVRMGLEQGKYSLTTAVGLFNSTISIALVVTANWISKKTGGEGIW